MINECKICGNAATKNVLVSHPSDKQKSSVLAHLCGSCNVKSDANKILEAKYFPQRQTDNNSAAKSEAAEFARSKAAYVKSRTDWKAANPGKPLPLPNRDSFYGILD